MRRVNIVCITHDDEVAASDELKKEATTGTNSLRSNAKKAVGL